jgi:3'-phosphoadenosine 5'-phosphosulfate sulfotransferase (PAPS reductase)/FAD synthetase
MNLKDYDFIIINSSGGKDSLCATYAICTQAKAENVLDRVSISHQDLGEAEWKGTKELVQQQADLFGVPMYVSQRRNSEGYNETLLEYVERRGKWPSNKQRFCTSDFKRGPGSRVVTALTKGKENCKVLYVFGFRKEESPARSKKQVLVRNTNLTTKTRIVDDYLPIHDWTLNQVWQTIRENNLPYHPAYDLGMPRLSCCFCIFSPFDALVIAGKHNAELLDKYVAVEEKIQHSFKNGFFIKEVKEAINNNYQPKVIQDWVM